MNQAIPSRSSVALRAFMGQRSCGMGGRVSRTSRLHSKRIALLVGLLALAAAWAPATFAQTQLQNLYPGFFLLQKPEVLDLILYGGGFGSPKYGSIQEGLQLEQSITPYFGVVGRVTGYQVWIGDHFQNPLIPEGAHRGQLNFARLEAGGELAVYPGTRLFILGGGDAGDSHAGVIEGDLSSWILTHSHHPLNFSFSANHDFQNHVTSAEIDLRMVALSTEKYLFTAGGGGAIYQGGAISSAAGQGGPDLGIYFRRWGLGIDVQAGYGSANGFGQLSFIKQLDFVE
jgi:hypothetical protein